MQFRKFTGWIIGILMTAVLMVIVNMPISASSPNQIIDPSATPTPFFDLFFPLSLNGVKSRTLQGFDRCTHPTPAQMQVWWDRSPYEVFNIYLGGVNFACRNQPIDPSWVQEVTIQGWAFTATWVGPQAPCAIDPDPYDNIPYPNWVRMKSDPSKSYTQGREEAAEAIIIAQELGLLNSENLTIQYDIEGYSWANPSDSCRAAVSSFLEGWSHELHLNGISSGAYGSPCSSYIRDWWLNAPGLDQIWIAHWTDTTFNQDANVWGVPCGVPDTFWPDNQRIKQYAGDHVEAYDGVILGIDSNVFDTDPVAVPTATPTPISEPGMILDFELVSRANGWVRTADSLFRTADNGRTWTEITPENFSLLSAGFLDSLNGWAAGLTAENGGLQVAHTQDGGESWAINPLDPEGTLSGIPLSSIYISILDHEQLWITVKLQSGSAFSIGRLFASSDGGQTWQARSIPIGEPVHFSNAYDGWTTGGPAGNETYRTFDGGLTWQPAAAPEQTYALNDMPTNAVQVSQPDGQSAWMLVQDGFCTGPKGKMSCRQEQSLLWTNDGGKTWSTISLPR